VIPAEAVDAARKVALERYGTQPDAAYIRTLLTAAAPYIIAGHFREINLKAIAHEIENPLQLRKDAL
jgi:hypothetical protein